MRDMAWRVVYFSMIARRWAPSSRILEVCLLFMLYMCIARDLQLVLFWSGMCLLCTIHCSLNETHKKKGLNRMSWGFS